MTWVVVDSGLALKLVLNETDSHLAEALWQRWLRDDLQPVAPSLFYFEVTAVLRKHVYRGSITPERGAQALQQALKFKVKLIDSPDLHERAWRLAAELNRPTAYDAHYLAAAEELKCDFWTADERLYNSARNRLAWVYWLGNFSS